MSLTEMGEAQGIYPRTAYRWFREGTLPVPAQRVGPRTILVNVEAVATPKVVGGVGRYACVSSHDQKPDLECQVARLSAWAARAGRHVVRVEAEVGPGMNGARARTRRLLADPAVTNVVVEHQRPAGFATADRRVSRSAQ